VEKHKIQKYKPAMADATEDPLQFIPSIIHHVTSGNIGERADDWKSALADRRSSLRKDLFCTYSDDGFSALSRSLYDAVGTFESEHAHIPGAPHRHRGAAQRMMLH
jgi:hypothetical protein